MNWVTGWDSQVHVAFILNYQFGCRHQSVIVEYCFRKYTCSSWLQGWVKDPWTGCTTNDGLSSLVVELFFRFWVTISQTLISFKSWITKYFFNQVWFIPYERQHTEVAGRFLWNVRYLWRGVKNLIWSRQYLNCIYWLYWTVRCKFCWIYNRFYPADTFAMKKRPLEIPELLKFYSSGPKCIPKMKWK